MNKLKKVKIIDIIKILYLLPAFICSLVLKLIYKIKKQELWLICETKNTARDNGIVFYKYMIKEHPEINTYYAINKKCDDYKYLKDYKNVISFGSFKHFIYYMAANQNLSSHKEGNPNHAIFTVLHLKFKLFNNRTFLQHGITSHNFNMFHYCNTYFKYFICGAKPELDFIREKFGYPTQNILYTGFARFDNLYDFDIDKKMILFIPTWRRWLDSREKFSNSDYYKNIISLINSENLDQLLIKYDKYLYFYPHMGSQNYMDLYKTNSKRIKILSVKDVNVQDLLKKASLMITDYSSVNNDFGYMMKPIIYYQHDLKDYLEKHVGKYCYDTYYSYEKNGFGPVINNETDLLKEIELNITNDFQLNSKYLERINQFFPIHDNHNCERIYKEVKGVKNE